MDSEILIFAAMNVIGGVLALGFVHFYYLPNVEKSSIEPALYEVTQRETLAVDPLRR
ncbi:MULTISPECIES: hypothetical protein [unclassified Rhizobium]|jgi:hypothetical protein|uniref:hypothetical protein n=1 Tax=unclassified Rhizobium TaxID=2613769 RepID=UPI000A602613|nr:MULTISPECIES: hypothetical protein [unclassified Rhizobium]